MIHIDIPTLPLSSNHAYFDVVVGRGKKRRTQRVLTDEGKKYKLETTTFIVSTYPQYLQMFKPNTAFGYIIRLHFPNLLNSTWPEKAESRYKKLDASNRVKLLEDAMAKAFGIDDKVFLSTRADKVQGEPRTEIWVWNMEEEDPYSVISA